MKLKECIIVSKEINDKFILAKNRDRAYNPSLEIVHTIIDGVEVAYLHDLVTDWSEGLNEKGIGVVNSALLVGHDEAEHKIVKKGGKPGPDGDKMRNIIKQPTLMKAVRAALLYKGISLMLNFKTQNHLLFAQITGICLPMLDIQVVKST